MDISLHSMAFEYSELSSSTSKRLLKVLPRSDQIHIRLWEEEGDVPYRCLSYTWGEPTPCFPIFVNGKPMQIRENLYKFLTVAAKRYANEPLWIDAICINQLNDTEKSVQVQRMGTIYEQATEVLVWLGDDPAMEKFVKWVRKPERTILFYCSRQISPRRLRKEIKIIAEHPYWTRAWIVQEVLLASSVRLVCGHTEALSGGVLKYKGSPLVNLLARYRLPWTAQEKALRLDWHFRSFNEVDEYNKIWRLFEVAKEHKFCGLSDFWEVFTQLTKDSHSSDPRDRIYSILAITGHQSCFTVDYSESRVDTFWRAAEHFTIWAIPQQIRALWKALCLNEEDKTSVRSRQRTLQFEILLQSSRKVPESEPSLNPMKQPETLYYYCERDHMKNPTRRLYCNVDDLILCPEMGHYGHHITHIIIRQHRHTNSRSFQILSSGDHPHQYFTPCPEDSELCFRANGKDTRVSDWDSVLQMTKLCEAAADDRESKSGFVLKISHEYAFMWLDYLDDDG